jgi:hypothetical protein
MFWNAREEAAYSEEKQSDWDIRREESSVEEIVASAIKDRQGVTIVLVKRFENTIISKLGNCCSLV